MSGWPEITHPVPLEGATSWTARFESFDQRKDDCYYEITLWTQGAPSATIWACVSAPCGASQAETEAQIREDLQRIARSGVSNTEYRGSMITQMSRR